MKTESASIPASITVVIPNKNDAAYLPKCLNSVLEQPAQPDEIIIIDDGSTDNSIEIIRSRIASVPQARLITNQNSSGTMPVLNQGLWEAASEYVIFLASNDYFVDGFIAKARASIARTGRPGVWSAMVWLVDESGRLLRLHPSVVAAQQERFFPPEKCLRLSLATGNWFTGTTLAFRRDLLQQIGGLDTDYLGLADLFAALTIASLNGAGFMPEPLGVMRIHAGGYLEKTLTDPKLFIPILTGFEQKGRALSPTLFSRKFCDRTIHRLLFSSICAQNVEHLESAAEKLIDARTRGLLRAVIRYVPGSFLRTKFFLAYVILRPYDVIPAIWYRLIRTLPVRLRSNSGFK